MRVATISSLLVAAAASSASLVTFDGAESTTFEFKALNDPVMGGKSTGTWTLGNGFGVLDGEVVNVPSLSAPGFIKAAADGKFPDLSKFIDGSLVLKVRTTTPEYAGFRATFVSGAASASFACAAGGSLPFSRGCFKDKFTVPAGSDFVDVKLPFSGFSDKWSSATGEQTTTCAQDKDVCPTASKLASIQRVEFWGEGANGKLHLEIQSVSAEDAAGNVVQLLMAGQNQNLVTFDGAKDTSFKFEELNDPVMGGKSTGTWALGDGFGTLDGEVVNVPSLSAPGFIKAAADGKFPDLSNFVDGNLVLKVRTSSPEYAGYRFTFVSGAASASFACAAGGSLPFSRGCFKDKFTVPAGDDFVAIKMPFSGFSDKWSSATGEQTTTCAQDKDVCPTATKLASIQRVEFWAEGANGKVHLDVQSVYAEDAAGNVAMLV